MKPSNQEKKWLAAIRKSGRFDREFYRRWYGDDPEVRRNLERHYVTIGETKGYWPCREFCPGLYLDANPDVAEASISPFYHYVTSGVKEGRFLRPSIEELRFQTSESLELPGSGAAYAIVIHIFHYEMWPAIAEKIASLEGKYDLFITVAQRPDRNFDELTAKIKGEFPDAAVFYFPNHGRDIFPFFRLINSGALSGYQAVGKIHTKKSPHLETGEDWSEHLIASLLPRAEASRELLERFLGADHCGVLTANGQKKTGQQWWHGNRGRALNLLSRAGIRADSAQLCFPAGSMYWLKPRMVEALKGLRLYSEDFEPESGQGDATTAHAVERVLGYLAEGEGLEVLEIGELSGQAAPENDCQSYDFCEAEDSDLNIGENLLSDVPPKLRRPPISHNVHYEGVLECCSPRGVVGWIREISDREHSCKIILTIDGVMVSEGFADLYRSDMGGRDDFDSYCGFILPLPEHFFDGEVHGFQITVLGEAWLYRSLRFQTRLARKEEMGEVEQVLNGGVIGWCRDPLDPEFKQQVDLLIDGYFAGGSEPCGESEDGHGFRLEVPPSFRDGKKHDVKVVVRGSRICLWEGKERLPVSGMV